MDSGLASLHAQVFQALSDAVIVTDLAWEVVDCNRAAEVMFAISRPDMLGRPLVEVGAGSAATVPAEVILRALREHGAWSGDVELPTIAADVSRIAASRILSVLDADGELVGFAVINREVTAERAGRARERDTAARLTHAEQLWRSMLDVAPTGLALVSLEGRFERVNDALCRTVGYTAEQLCRLTFQEITHPEDLADDLAQVRRLLLGQITHYALEKRYLHARGYAVWVQLSVSLIRDTASGRPEQYVVAVEDITERRRASERLAAIIAGASEAFVGIAPGGYVTEWNTAAERLFGWTRTEALGRALETLIVPPQHREAHREGLRRQRLGEPARVLNRRLELSALTKDGQQVPVELSVWRADGSQEPMEQAAARRQVDEPQAGGGPTETGGEFYAFIRDTTERTQAARRQRAIAEAQLAIADVELSPRKVMQAICQHAQALTGADAASVEIVEGDDLVCRAATGTAQPHQGLRLRVDASLSGLATSTGSTLICHDSETDPRVDAEACRRTGARSLIVVPLRRADQIHGVVTVTSARPGRFDQQDCDTLTLLAAPFGAALLNAWRLEASTQQALIDPLTGLGNRALALRELERALLRQARRATGYTALMFLDLDGFKQVNDSFGHQTGDEVLTAVARKLQLALRTTDTCARYGGDEFLVICENFASVNDSIVLAERLITLIAGTYALGADEGALAEVGVSIGIAVSATAIPAADLLQAGDEAMYEAKNQGGTTYAIRRL
jgi:diguanylate cyclase (GGDEF)-like protein/PAS domain S-box-containing protein